MQLFCITTLVGFPAGLMARRVTPRSGANGFVSTIMIGTTGTLAAAFFGQSLHWYESDQLAGFVGTIVGTTILLVGCHVLACERRVNRFKVKSHKSGLLCG